MAYGKGTRMILCTLSLTPYAVCHSPYHHPLNMAKDSAGGTPSGPGSRPVGNPARGVKIAGAPAAFPPARAAARLSGVRRTGPAPKHPETCAAKGFAPKRPPDAGFGVRSRKSSPGAGLGLRNPRKGHVSCISTGQLFGDLSEKILPQRRKIFGKCEKS